MKTTEFKKKIAHLSQQETMQTALTTIHKIMVAKGIATVEEMQNTFLEAMRQKPVARIDASGNYTDEYVAKTLAEHSKNCGCQLCWNNSQP